MRSFIITWLLLALSFSAPSWAQDMDQEIEADLQAIEFGTIDQMVKEFQVKPRVLKEEKKRWYRETPWSPAPFRVVIRKGTLIEDMEGEKRFIAPRDITTWVKMPYASSVHSSILDKQGQPRFRVRSNKMVDIERIVNMTPDIDPYKTYESKPLFSAVDKELELKTIFSYGAHTGDAAFYANLFGGDSTGLKATRTELKTFFALDLPVQFGLGISLENGSWENQQDGLPVEWQMISVGPAVRMPFATGETFVWSGQLSIQRTLSSSATLNQESEISLSATTFEVQVEMALPTRYGSFAFFAGYNRQEMAAKDGPSDVLYYSSDTGSNQSTFMGLNYQFGWKL